MASGFSLKDQLFNEEKTRYLAGLFASAHPGFDGDVFVAAVMERLPALELKERITWIAAVLGDHLPGDLPEVAPILRAALPPPLDPEKTDDDFGDFIFAPVGEFVVARGLQTHPELSLDLLCDITQRFSMEWAVRPFLNTWPEQTLTRMIDWAQHDNYHVRRLASEGTRPRLPWGMAVGLDLADPLPILDMLHRDATRYVTRSVANHLNDISKKQPGLVMGVLEKWIAAGQQSEKELRWITAHALRGLIKSGDPDAMKLLGYDAQMPAAVELTLAQDRVKIGDVLQFDCKITGPDDAPVLVDYRLDFPKPGGGARSKVFKLKQTKLAGGQAQLRKKHRLKGDASTFRLFPGAHHIAVMVNGVVRAQSVFQLVE